MGGTRDSGWISNCGARDCNWSSVRMCPRITEKLRVKGKGLVPVVRRFSGAHCVIAQQVMVKKKRLFGSDIKWV
ncbi:unnamed protein product [Urochloa humidicola]